MSIPLVTIGITAFNAAKSLELAVHSALSQTWKSIEIVIVDDCSTDETPLVLDQLISLHANLSVFVSPINRGVAASRNQILAIAKGEFIAFFDDDDESLPERIERQVSRILDYEQNFAEDALVICHTARRVRYPDRTERIHPTMGQREGKLAPHGVAVARRALLGTPLEDGYGSCPTCSQMARLSTYEAVGGFDTAFRRSEDSDFLVRLAKLGGHFVGIADPLVLQTMTKTSDKNLTDERRYALMFLKKHRDIVDQQNLYDFCWKWLNLKYTWLEQKRSKFILELILISFTNPFATLSRLYLSFRNIDINRSFSQFHQYNEGSR